MFVLLSFVFVTVLKASSPITRVAIVGSGPAGLSLAASLNLLDSKVSEVLIYETRKEFLQNFTWGRCTIDWRASILSKLGLSQQLHKRAQPLKRVYTRNAREETILDLNVQSLIQKKADKELRDNNDQPLRAIPS